MAWPRWSGTIPQSAFWMVFTFKSQVIVGRENYGIFCGMFRVVQAGRAQVFQCLRRVLATKAASIKKANQVAILVC